MIGFKIFEKRAGHYPAMVRTIHRGHKSSRSLPVNKWLKSTVRTVTDGTNSKPYLSGWHFFKDPMVAFKYADKFKKECVIMPVQVFGYRQKPTNKDVYLAHWMKVL
jgi:hypothetical protein